MSTEPRVYLGPGVDAAHLEPALKAAGLGAIALEPGAEPPQPSVFVLDGGALQSADRVRAFARAGAVLVLGGAEGAPERAPGAGWLPADAHPSAVTAALRFALQAVEAKARVRRLEQAEIGHRARLSEMNRIGIALSSERDIDKLQDLILGSCRQITGADGATLYLVEESEDGHKVLRFAWSQNASVSVPFATFKMPLVEKSVGGYTVLTGKAVVIEDVYTLPSGVPYGFNRSFDEQHGYRTRSILCVPMRNHEGDIVGAIQLINAKREPAATLNVDNVDQLVVPFAEDHLELIQSIASQAAVALDNKALIDAIQNLFEGFVKASVTAIESRDPTTYGHSGRVAALTVGLAEATNSVGTGRYKDFFLDLEQLRELRYAGLLHDFGKVGVREHVLVKEKKLYGPNIELLKSRFAFVQRSVQQRYTERKLQLAMERHGDVGAADFAAIDRELEVEIDQLREWLDAVLTANEPSILPEDKASMLAFLAEYFYEDLEAARRPLLQPEEFHFLSIRKGTLDEVERLEIESHVTHSYRFLTKIPWTPAMRNVPQYAYGHHELLDGSGYPRKLQGPEIPVQARMMTISDVFDALTATDRPYKRAVPLPRALDILEKEFVGKMDAELLEIFIQRRVYELAASYRPDQDLLLTGLAR